jgi:hypothetical protein
MPKPSKTDLTVARYTARKVDSIVLATYKRFYSAIEEYGTLAPDELLAIGLNLFMKITVEPMEKLSPNPKEMRRQLIAQLGKMIKQEGDEVVN